MVVSTMNSILRRRWLSVFIILLFCLSYVNDEGSTTKVQSTGNCTNVPVVTIDEESEEKKIWFFCMDYSPDGEKIFVAVLNYDKPDISNPTNGYTCTSTTDATFNINLGGAPMQNVLLVGNGQQPSTCQPIENLQVKITNSNNHNCYPCANDTEPRNSVYHSRQKRYASQNRSPEPSAGVRKPGDTCAERGNPEDNVLVGLIIGTTAFPLLAVLIILYLRRGHPTCG